MLHVVDGNAATVVDYGDGVIEVDSDFDFVGVAGERFVYRVIDYFVDQMMQAEFAGRAYVHGGTLAHGFHAAEDFDGIGGVVSVGGFAVLVLRVVVLRVVFRVDDLPINEFGLQFFRGHSAPWRMPDSDAWLEGRFRDCSGEVNLLNFLLVSCHQSLRYFNTKGAYFEG